MTPERARWLLEHPANSAPEVLSPEYIERVRQADGAILTALTAIDR